MNNLLIVDGSALLSMLFFASISELMQLTRDVDEINEAVSGFFREGHGHYSENVGSFISKVFCLKDELMADSVAVVFDKNSASTFRRQMFSDYKAHRPPKPAAIKDQMLVLHCILNKIGIKAFWSDEYEADDLAGSLITAFKEEFDAVYFFTTDCDWLQLLDTNVKGIMPRKDEQEAEGFRTYYAMRVAENNAFSYGCPKAKGRNLCVTADICKDYYGVESEQVIDFKGLAGDASDNIPGVKGVGNDTAKDLLRLFGDMDSVYDAVNSLSEKEFKEKTKAFIRRSPYNALKNGYGDALMSKDLATIRTDLKVPVAAQDLKVRLHRPNTAMAIRLYNLENDLDYVLRTN